MKIEETILKSFKRKMGRDVENLDLIVCISPDCFPDDYNEYSCEVMESRDNGMVWVVYTDQFGNVSETFEIN